MLLGIKVLRDPRGFSFPGVCFKAVPSLALLVNIGAGFEYFLIISLYCVLVLVGVAGFEVLRTPPPCMVCSIRFLWSADCMRSLVGHSLPAATHSLPKSRRFGIGGVVLKNLWFSGIWSPRAWIIEFCGLSGRPAGSFPPPQKIRRFSWFLPKF